eukprot:2503587-Rhodomonas_salina.2
MHLPVHLKATGFQTISLRSSPLGIRLVGFGVSVPATDTGMCACVQPPGNYTIGLRLKNWLGNERVGKYTFSKGLPQVGPQALRTKGDGPLGTEDINPRFFINGDSMVDIRSDQELRLQGMLVRSWLRTHSYLDDTRVKSEASGALSMKPSYIPRAFSESEFSTRLRWAGAGHRLLGLRRCVSREHGRSFCGTSGRLRA